VLASADTQLLLILAFGLSFYATSQCSISLYHYLVAHHIVLVGLATSVQAFVVVRSPLKVLVTSIARLVVMSICLAQLFAIKGAIASLKPNLAKGQTGVLDTIPSRGQQESLLLLPAYCILHESFNPFLNLTSFQAEKLRNKGIQRGAVSQNYIILMLIALLMLVLLSATIQKCWRRDKPVREKWEKRLFWIKTAIKFSGFMTCLVLTIFNWIIILRLRNWMNQNEWLNDDPSNPENGVKGFGQYAPLASLGTVFVTLFNGLSGGLLKKWSWLYRGDDDFEDNDDGKSVSSDSFEMLPRRCATV
jgi:hypothetical protein